MITTLCFLSFLSTGVLPPCANYGNDGIIGLDFRILFWIQNYIVNPILTPIFKIITMAGNAGILWFVIALLLLISKKTRPWSLAIVFSLVLTGLVGNVVIKNLVARPRPFQMMYFELMIAPPSGYSFPSGHTLSSFAAATAIFCYNKKWGVTASVVAFLMGFSRLYFFVHFPSDVIVGAVLGLLLGWLGYRMSEKVMPWAEKKIDQLVQ